MHSEARHQAPHPTAALPAVSPGRIRLRGAVLAGVCVAILVLGWRLTPQQSGLGTHRQLGLPSCSFLVHTGYPCPSCGLTTSLAAMMHGRWAAAWRAHPFGVVMVAAVAGLAGVGLGELATGRSLLRRLRGGWWWLVGGLAGMLAGWAVKLTVGIASGEYPIR